MTLEKEMATHSSVLAWRIPGMEEPGRLPSVGSHRVGHDRNDLAAAAFNVWCGKTSELSPYSCLINKTLWQKQKLWPWEFPGGPVVKILAFHCHGPASIPGQETEILQAVWHSQKKKTCGPYCHTTQILG